VPKQKGQAILRYLAAQPRHRATVDALVDALWPDDSAEIARHKLHVAASALRGALNGDFADRKGAGYLVFNNGGYELDPDTITSTLMTSRQGFEPASLPREVPRYPTMKRPAGSTWARF